MQLHVGKVFRRGPRAGDRPWETLEITEEIPRHYHRSTIWAYKLFTNDGVMTEHLKGGVDAGAFDVWIQRGILVENYDERICVPEGL